MPQGTSIVRFVAGAMAIILWLYIEYTGARGAAIALSIAGVAMFLFVPVRVAARVLAVGLMTLLIALSISLTLPPAECESFGMFNRLTGTVDSTNPDTGRVEIWRMTWELITARPWLGYGEIRLYNFVDTPVTQPHNAMLQILLAWGVVGTALFLAIVGELLVRIGVAARRGPWQAWPVIFGLLTILIYGQISGALYHAFPLLFATILSAAAAALLLAPKPHPVV